MPTTIKLKNSVTTTSAPTSLAQGEVAINVTDKKVWVGNAATTPVQLLGGGADGNFSTITVTGNSFLSTTSGNVGIGTSSPAYKLDVSANNPTRGIIGRINNSAGSSQTGSQLEFLQNGIDYWSIGQPAGVSAFSFYAGRNSVFDGTEIMRLTNTGSLKMGAPNAGGKFLGISDGSTDAANYGTVQVVKPADHDNIWAYSVVQAGQNVAGMGFVDNVASNFSVGIGDSPSTASGGAKHLYTGSILAAYTSNLERMRIDASGNVGIGTSTVTTAFNKSLQVYQPTTGNAGLRVNAGSTTGFDFIQDQTGASFIYNRDNSFTAFGTNNTERMRIHAGGNVSIGTAVDYAEMTMSTAYGGQLINLGDGTLDAGNYGLIQITRPATNDTRFAYACVRNGLAIAGIGFSQSSNTFVVVNGGSNVNNGMTLAPGGTSWGTQSDIRKKNILGNIENGVEKISKLRTVYFEYKNDDKKVKRVGFIAQDVNEVLPEAVHTEDNEEQILNVQYSDLIPLLAKAIQEQQVLIENLTTRLNALEGK